jgi:hypothetical protein
MDNLVELTTIEPAEVYNPSNIAAAAPLSESTPEPKSSRSKSEAKSGSKSKAKPKTEPKSKAKPESKPDVSVGSDGLNASPPVDEAEDRSGMYQAENGDWMDDLSDPDDDSLTYDELGLGGDYEIVDADDPERLMAESSGVGWAGVSHSNGHKG